MVGGWWYGGWVSKCSACGYADKLEDRIVSLWLEKCGMSECLME